MPGKSRCLVCTAKENARIAAWRQSRRDGGLCVDCSTPCPGRSRCPRCAAVSNHCDKRRAKTDRKRIVAQRERRRREAVQRRAARAEALLAAQAQALAARLAEAKKPRPRQLSFKFKRKAVVQRFGTGVVVNVRTWPADYRSQPGTPDYARWSRHRSNRIDKALRNAGHVSVVPVVTPEWIEEDRRDEFLMLSHMALARKAL